MESADGAQTKRLIYTSSSDGFMDIVACVNSSYFCVCFDTGNALRIADDPVASASLLNQQIWATCTKEVKPMHGVNPKEWYFFR